MRSVFLNFPFSNDAPTRLFDALVDSPLNFLREFCGFIVIRDDAMFNSTINQGGGA
jgi:hypothetical protein